jgi:hypothetical protein
MESIQYFFAAVYQSIKSRRPDGTPYFNLCLGIAGILLLNIVDALLMLKIWFHTNLISQSKNTFIVGFLSLAVLIIVLVRAIIPIDTIRDVEVDQKDVKRKGLLFISYFMLSVALMIVLLILTRPNVGKG